VERPAQLGPFLAISREVGSGGAEVARRIGQRLGWSVLDRQLVEDLARRLELSPQMLELLDETRSNWFHETMLNLMNSKIMLQNSFLTVLGKVLHLAAYDGKVIFVGRGGHLLLPRERGLMVRLIAPREVRLATIQAREKLDAAEAERLLDELEPRAPPSSAATSTGIQTTRRSTTWCSTRRCSGSTAASSWCAGHWNCGVVGGEEARVSVLGTGPRRFRASDT